MKLPGLTQNEKDAAAKNAALEAELSTLKGECEALDLAAVRPLRAVAAGIANDEDRSAIEANEAAVAGKRSRINEIKSQLGI